MEQELIFTKESGYKIAGKVFRPDDSGRKYPTAIFSHGFGSNYAGFGRCSLMERVMKANNCWPENVLCADNTDIWEHYEKVDVAPVIGGMHRNRRYLYKGSI